MKSRVIASRIVIHITALLGGIDELSRSYGASNTVESTKLDAGMKLRSLSDFGLYELFCRTSALRTEFVANKTSIEAEGKPREVRWGSALSD